VTLATRWLEREGYGVHHVGTGPAALEALARDPLPDLVLLDVMLPRIDGFAVLRKLRAEERTRTLPVMIVSSFDLSVPAMILGETALSFLGLGLRPPITSWGVLLNEAQNINVVALYP
jgi:DNA-binding NtrC family response regulator